jgi:hypothetical protein
VVTSWYVGERCMERYGCGHVAEAKRDLMGYTNAKQRRCRQCAADTAKKGGT